MNKSTVLTIGGLFLVGLVILSFVNFLSFSPTTPSVLEVTKQYNKIEVSLSAQEILCNKGAPTCDSKHPKLIVSINNQWTEISYDLVFLDINGVEVGPACQPSMTWDPGFEYREQITFNCEDLSREWSKQNQEYIGTRNIYSRTTPITACVEFQETNGKYDRPTHETCVTIVSVSQ